MAEQVLTQCTVGGPVKVTVRDGRIIRMRPIIFDETDKGGWTIEARGKKFSDPRMTTLNPYVVGERMRVYSENRIKYPMKRKHFDPNGERHPELRGNDEYVRIPWDEALDIVAGEIKTAVAFILEMFQHGVRQRHGKIQVGTAPARLQ